MKFAFNPLTSQFELKANNCNSGSTGTPAELASTPLIQNVPITDANSEMIISIPNGTKKILLKVRDYSASLKISYTPGESGTNYISVIRGNSYSENNISISGNKIYIQSTKPNVVVECLTWV